MIDIMKFGIHDVFEVNMAIFSPSVTIVQARRQSREYKLEYMLQMSQIICSYSNHQSIQCHKITSNILFCNTFSVSFFFKFI